jgi:uncharacterized protein YjbI with pentapeptide repeats
MTREKTWQKLFELGVVSGDMPNEQWNLSKAALNGADLSDANLTASTLIRGDFTKAILNGVCLPLT